MNPDYIRSDIEELIRQMTHDLFGDLPDIQESDDMDTVIIDILETMMGFDNTEENEELEIEREELMQRFEAAGMIGIRDMPEKIINDLIQYISIRGVANPTESETILKVLAEHGLDINTKEENNMAVKLENAQQEEENAIVRYIRKTENIPNVKAPEIDTETWEIKNSKNYDEINPDWKEKYNNKELDMKLSICVRCGSPLKSSYRYHDRKIRTLCNDCINHDRRRLEEAFMEEWEDIRFTLTKRGKEAEIAQANASTYNSKFPEDLSISYKMEYVESGIGCNREYTLDDIFNKWEIGGLY